MLVRVCSSMCRLYAVLSVLLLYTSLLYVCCACICVCAVSCGLWRQGGGEPQRRAIFFISASIFLTAGVAVAVGTVACGRGAAVRVGHANHIQRETVRRRGREPSNRPPNVR